jgi:acyl-coenzyme A thioesterase PaaI-like protein
MDTIRDRVLRGIALNREPGFHYAGNFLGISYDVVAKGGTRVSLEPGPHCVDRDGQVNAGVVAMVADIALATSVRAALDSSTTRLATVGMHLQFTGAPLKGALRAEGEFQGFLPAASPQGLSRVSIEAGGERACFGTGAFMPLAPPPGVTMHPVVTRPRRESDVLAESELDPAEREMLRHADAALTPGERDFISRFFGYEAKKSADGATCVLRNGAHVGNRVGHVQGGILVGLGAATASAALPSSWALSSISAWFVSPGEGKALEATARVSHHGRHTAVVRTEVIGAGGRRVLEVVTAHARHAA